MSPIIFTQAASISAYPGAFVPISPLTPPSSTSVTVMTLSAARRLSLIPLIDRSLATKAIGVGVGTIVGRIRGVRMTLGGETVECDVAVLEDGRDGERNVECLVGLDVLNKLEAVIDVRRGITLRGGRKVPWADRAPKVEQRRQPTRQPSAPPSSSRAFRRRSPPPPPPSIREEPTYNPDTNTYIPPVDLEVEAELDQLDDDEIEEIIRREDKDDVRGMERKYDYINGQETEEEEDVDESESESDFDMSGV